MKIAIFADLDEVGIGISIGKTRYDQYKMYFSVEILVVNLVVWFWRN